MNPTAKIPIQVVVQGRVHEAVFERCGANIKVYTAQGSRTAPLRKFRAEELAQLVALAVITNHFSAGDRREA